MTLMAAAILATPPAISCLLVIISSSPVFYVLSRIQRYCMSPGGRRSNPFSETSKLSGTRAGLKQTLSSQA